MTHSFNSWIHCEWGFWRVERTRAEEEWGDCQFSVNDVRVINEGRRCEGTIEGGKKGAIRRRHVHWRWYTLDWFVIPHLVLYRK
jgi:hypothetical protein